MPKGIRSHLYMEKEEMSRNDISSNWWQLALISSIGLFLELAVIRWLSGEVRLFSYLKNISLLSAFLGFAIGFAIVGRGRDYKKAFAPLFCIFTLLVLAFGTYISPQSIAYPGSIEVSFWYAIPISYWASLISFLGIVLVFFLVTMFLFIPLGQATGEEMNLYNPTPAYIVNIAASLFGIWIFSLISFFQTQPIVWFVIVIIGYIVFSFSKRFLSRLDIFLYTVSLVALLLLGNDATWSPYQRLQISELNLKGRDGKQVRLGYSLDVQHVFYQRALDLSSGFIEHNKENIPEIVDIENAYSLPYVLSTGNERVLVIGSGMGNDIAAALRNNMEKIDAVEIDPAILKFGIDLHPESPYSDDRVVGIVNDARSYLEQSNENYDVIAFGLLDSHTLLSGWSSVRLDSYVYTLESIQNVKSHLKDNGIVSLTFAANEWIEERLGRMLIAVFGSGNVWIHHSVLGTTFIAGRINSEKFNNAKVSVWQPNPSYDEIPMTFDDWPYLYMRERQIPRVYWQSLLLILIITTLILFRSFPETLHPDWHFWFLGAAFILVEFIGVTRLALLFGTTWLVNALAISGVLIMILGANLVVLWKGKLSQRLNYFMLFISLIFLIFFPLEILNQLESLPRALGSILVLSIPIFFSGLIFAEALRRTGSASGPLASNLIGSVFGGVLEYSALLWGINNLYLLASGLYVLAFIFYLRSR